MFVVRLQNVNAILSTRWINTLVFLPFMLRIRAAREH